MRAGPEPQPDVVERGKGRAGRLASSSTLRGPAARISAEPAARRRDVRGTLDTHAVRHLLRNRRIAVAAGVTLVLVPTLFSIFPAWQQWAVGTRIVILAGWFISAAFVVWSTTIQSEQVDELVGEPLRRQTAARAAAAQRLLSALLDPMAAGLPEHYVIRVYLPNEQGVLQPEYSAPSSEDAESWEEGRGATGMAWETNGLIVARGDSVADGTYGLSQVQQRRYANLATVASLPIQTARGQRMGVLSVSSEQDDHHLEDPQALDDLTALADVVARVLIDVLQLRSD